MAERILKLFGISEKQIQNRIKDIPFVQTLGIQIEVKNLESKLSAFVSDDNRIAFSKVFSALVDFVYADEDVSVFVRLNDLLQVRRKRISFLEQGTGGIVVSNLLQLDSIGRFVKSSLVISDPLDLVTKLDIDPILLSEKGIASSETAFEVCSIFSQREIADFCVLTLAKLDDPLKTREALEPRGLCFVAICGESGMKIHKHNFFGTKSEIMNTLAVAVCFHLIKELF